MKCCDDGQPVLFQDSFILYKTFTELYNDTRFNTVSEIREVITMLWRHNKSLSVTGTFRTFHKLLDMNEVYSEYLRKVYDTQHITCIDSSIYTHKEFIGLSRSKVQICVSLTFDDNHYLNLYKLRSPEGYQQMMKDYHA